MVIAHCQNIGTPVSPLTHFQVTRKELRLCRHPNPSPTLAQQFVPLGPWPGHLTSLSLSVWGKHCEMSPQIQFPHLT